MQFLTIVTTQTLGWSPAREIALFYGLAGAAAIAINTLVFKAAVERFGIMRVGLAGVCMRAVAWAVMPTMVLLARDLGPTVGRTPAAVAVFIPALIVTFGFTINGSFNSIVMLVRAMCCAMVHRPSPANMVSCRFLFVLQKCFFGVFKNKIYSHILTHKNSTTQWGLRVRSMPMPERPRCELTGWSSCHRIIITRPATTVVVPDMDPQAAGPKASRASRPSKAGLHCTSRPCACCTCTYTQAHACSCSLLWLLRQLSSARSDGAYKQLKQCSECKPQRSG